ncbi:MAG: L,D-transpeptidase [Nanoarchaeota archaeon]|nr:L,D-transpeptidase [Nanoarchaeota archaeon]
MGKLRTSLAGIVLGVVLMGSPPIVSSQVLTTENFLGVNHSGLRERYDVMDKKFGVGEGNFALILNGQEQRLYVVYGRDNSFYVYKHYGVSTGKRGFGNAFGSEKTPLGVHRINVKRGDNAGVGSIFVGGNNTGRVARITQSEKDSSQALLLTRVLGIGGCDSLNSNSSDRGIFIHGTNKEGSIGRPDSGGCIRMRNEDIVELYSLVREGTYLDIVKSF